MDSLVESLSEFEVEKYPNNPNAPHPHYSLYKSKPTGSSQEERRRMVLEARKVSRYDLVKHLRHIEGKEDYVEEEETESSKDVNQHPVAIYSRPKAYRNFIMLSEWLVEIPENFADTYVALPCPVGKRCLIVAYKGLTSVYAKNGACLKSFPSALPGGSNKTKKFGYTMLDCIFSDTKFTFYIIDLICWNRRSYLDCETNFRFNWLQSRISEWEDDISKVTKSNRYSFIPIPHFECNPRCLEQMLKNDLPFNVELDGVLFYHKESHYTHGPSPLICWLKAFMFPEMLSVPIPEKYLMDRPSNYINMSSHIKEFEKERRERILAIKRLSRRPKSFPKKSTDEMDVSEGTPEEMLMQ